MYINGNVCGELRAYGVVPGILALFYCSEPLDVTHVRKDTWAIFSTFFVRPKTAWVWERGYEDDRTHTNSTV